MSPAANEDRGGLRPALVSLVVFAVALAPRLFVALQWAPEPVWDGFYYDIGARSIARGMGYVGENGNPWCHYPVGYSAFLGGVYRVFGASPVVGKVAGALVGALMALATHRIARHATSERRALVAGLAVALYPGFIAYGALHMTEPLSALLVLFAGWTAIAGAERPRPWIATVGTGVLLGLATLVRPQSVVLAPLVALPALRQGRWRSAALHSLATLAIALITVAPWTLRNCRVMDGCAFVSTNGGWNLAIGSFPRATGRFETLRSGDGCHIVTGQVQQDRCWVELGTRWIRDDPARWVGLMPTKLGFTFDHESFPIGYLGEADPKAWPEWRKRIGRGLLSWTHRLVLLLGALALLPRPRLDRPRTLLAPTGVLLFAWYAAWDWSPPFWLLAVLFVILGVTRWRRASLPTLWAVAVTASLIVIHAVFFGEDRYHLVATPWWCVVLATLFSPRSTAEAGATEPKESTPAEEATSDQPPATSCS